MSINRKEERFVFVRGRHALLISEYNDSLFDIFNV